MTPFYQDEAVTLYRGDCFDALRGMEDSSVDAVIADPPFFLPAQHYAARREWARSLSDLSILEHFYRDLFDEVRRVLFSRSHCLFFCDSQSYPVFYVSAYRHFANLLALVWDKGRIGLGKPWRNQHELIMACWDGGAQLSNTQSTLLRYEAVPSADRGHPAEKPVDLMRRLVMLTTEPGDTVLDPFCGVGSTGVACVLEGRKFIGVEREAEYCDIAVERFKAARHGYAPTTATQQDVLPMTAVQS